MDSDNSPQVSGDGSPYTGGTQIPPDTQTPPIPQNPYFNQVPPSAQNPYFNQVPGGNIFGGGFTPYFPGNQHAAFPQISGSTFVGAGRPITPQVFHWNIGRGIDPNYGDAVYRPEMLSSTPGTDGSTTIPVTDPSFSTEEYEVEEMHPSPPKEKGKGKEKEKEKEKEKGKGKGKGKTQADPEAPSAPAPKGRRPRTHYTSAETLALARCWIDIGEDAVVSNNQRKLGFWTRIAQRYNEEGVKPKGAPSHKAPELRKHFERVMFAISKFNGIYENNCRMMTSGMSYDDVRDLSLAHFTSTVSSAGFQHWDVYIKLKDHEKFRAGFEAAAATGSGRTKLVRSGSFSGSGPTPTDLTESVEVVQPTPRRPMGVKAAKAATKAKGKGKSQGSASQSTGGDAEGDVRIAGYAQLHKFYRLYREEPDDRVKLDIWKTINRMKKQMGLHSDDEADADP